MEYITLPEAKIPVTMKADVVVVGAGPAGFGAATRSARNGADTLVIERFGCPGGNMINAFMCALKTYSHGRLETELADRLRSEGVLFDAFEAYPEAQDNPLVHGSGRINFPPDIGAILINKMMEERGVRSLFRSLFVDAVVIDNTLDAVIVENASGRQAVRGRVFIDSTGVGDLVARSGAPFISPGCRDEKGLQLTGEEAMGFPVPASLMWKMSGVDFEKLFEYQKTDPTLELQIRRAKSNGDIPDRLFTQHPKNVYAARYKGHPSLDMCPLAGGPGEMLVWGYIPYEWALNCAESGSDASGAEVEMRKFIFAEWKFLKKYVPGFEKAWISGIAPSMGIRDGRHPVGEYTLTYDDLTNERKHSDAALVLKKQDPLYFRHPGQSPRTLTFDVPYRSFLPKKIDNLLLSGDCMAFTHECRINVMKSIGWSMRTGEVAGEAAALSLKHGIVPKKLKWDRLLND